MPQSIDYGNHGEADDDSQYARNNSDRTALDCRDDVRTGSHGDHDGDVYGTPEQDAAVAGGLHMSGLLKPVADKNQQQHGDTDPADIRINSNKDSQQLADDQSNQQADRKQSGSINSHVEYRLSDAF